MSEFVARPATIRVRGSRSQLEAVKRSAEAAGLLLAREGVDSAEHLGHLLAEIDGHEDLAQLEGRLLVVERHLERLAARPEHSDQLIDSELAVMRARLEDTLRALAEVTQEHENTMASVERGVALIASEAERRNRAAMEILRLDLSGKIDAVNRSSEAVHAQMTAEKRAFEEEAARRAAALAGAIAEGREALRTGIGTALGELQERMDRFAEGVAANHPGREELFAQVQSHLDDWLSEPLDEVERLHDQLAAAHQAATEQVEQLRNDLVDGIQASEEKALGAAVHLESIILQVRRQLVGDETEWSAIIGEAGETMGSLRHRVEELLARVCDLEAGAAAERGASTAERESLERRMEQHEGWARASLAEVSELGLRCAAIESRQASDDQLRLLVEQQAGTIAFLTQRMADLENRLADAAALPDQPGPAAGPADGHPVAAEGGQPAGEARTGDGQPAGGAGDGQLWAPLDGYALGADFTWRNPHAGPDGHASPNGHGNGYAGANGYAGGNANGYAHAGGNGNGNGQPDRAGVPFAEELTEQ
jgi:hypothetical protein